jgi:hypothetical protein
MHVHLHACLGILWAVHPCLGAPTCCFELRQFAPLRESMKLPTATSYADGFLFVLMAFYQGYWRRARTEPLRKDVVGTDKASVYGTCRRQTVGKENALGTDLTWPSAYLSRYVTWDTWPLESLKRRRQPWFIFLHHAPPAPSKIAFLIF